jgi:hypothetical protein
MAKKTTDSSDNISVNTFNKGLVKDYDYLVTPDNNWTHARNAVNNSGIGELFVLGNEPSTVYCTKAPYDVIGAIHLYADKWAIFSTDDTNSEIGLFDESECTYNKIINSSCLAFKKNNLITGAAKENFDCTWQIYFDDGLNPSRTLNIDNPPFIETETIVDGCIIKTPTDEVDCEALRLAPLFKIPCIRVERGAGSGTLRNGTYQAAIAYSVNDQRVTDYVGLSNLLGVFAHENVVGSIEITLDGLETDNFDEYHLVIISSANMQTVAKRLGTYSTRQSKVFLDALPDSLVTIPIADIPLNIPSIEKSDAMFATEDHLVRVAPASKFDFNYQPQANKIKADWVAVKYPFDYYKEGGINTGYMRDEQYAFFIRWIYNTGDKSSSYHIPGRSAIASDLTNVANNDVVDFSRNKNWQVYNTATITSLQTSTLPDGGVIVGTGKMGYWESTEKYSDDDSVRWAELCGKQIRHHKFPDDCITPRHTQGGQEIIVLGVKFSGITIPLDNYGVPISGIVGYEILRGSREGNRSIIAKGLIANMGIYNIPKDISNKKGLYANYPYNDLRPDPYLTEKFIGDGRGDRSRVKPFQNFSKKHFTFHSPDTQFVNPYLSARVLKIYGESFGTSNGQFIEPYKHPKHKMVSDTAFFFALLIGGIGSIYAGLKGKKTTKPLTCLLDGMEATIAEYADPTGLFSVAKKLLTSCEIEESQFASLPKWLKVVGFIPAVFSFTAEGTNAFLDLIRNFLNYRQYALQYVSHGFYDSYSCSTINNKVRKINKAVYVNSLLNDFDENYRINNVKRPRTVVIETTNDILNPNNIDVSRFTLQQEGDQNKDLWKEVLTERFSKKISSHYAGMVLTIGNQYGQIDGIKQLPTGCIVDVPTSVTSGQKLTSPVIFGGDVYINRYTEKNTMLFFNDWMHDLPDGHEWNYRDYINIPFPRYWMDTTAFDFNDFITGLGQNIAQIFKVLRNAGRADDDEDQEQENTSGFVNAIDMLPSDMFNFDRKSTPSAVFWRFLSFNIKNAYFYLFNSGVRDFFAESEINVAYRDHEERPETRHYDYKEYTDLSELFKSNIIWSGNFFKYDFSLSASRFYNQFISWGIIQTRDYDPFVAEKCYTYYSNRIHYSLPNQDEYKKDNWRVYLVNNYKDFKSRVTAVKMAGDARAVILYENDSPDMFMPLEQLQTDFGTKISIGNGELFNQSLKKIVYSDSSYEFASCQNRNSAISTPVGFFWVSQNQGKIFNYSSGIEEISNNGMRWWFANHLPYQLTKDFPEFELKDNQVNGIGIATVYDNTNGTVYFTKKDYKLKPEFVGVVKYDKGNSFSLASNPLVQISLHDSNYFDSASWTVSYDPKTKAWVSFHDWHPEFLMPATKHFLSVKGDAIWKHNISCQSYCNYYGVNYPFEVELVSTSGQTVNTLRSVEYALDCYVYKPNCIDAHHILDENFDRAVVSNTEQVSGLLRLNITPKNNSAAILNYPQVNPASIDILYSKEENKYRFNQFWDVTSDRGEFTAVRRNIWNTAPNGYIRTLNGANLDYNKNPHEHKRFRHRMNNVLFIKNVSGSTKMLLKVSSSKLLYSAR